MKKIILFFILLILSINIPAAAAASGQLSRLELLSGTGSAKVLGEGNYKIIPIFLSLNYDIKQSIEVLNSYKGVFEFIIEPFISYAYEPDNNFEAGNNFAFKIGFSPDNTAFQPYFKAGIGFIYISQEFLYQATQLNFTQFGGFGAHYFFNEKTAFTLEFRFRHASNADIKEPNAGISGGIGLIGISYNF